MPSALDGALDTIELGRLVASSIESVVSAQEKLDQYTLDRAREFREAQPGDLAIPPLWYTFQDVSLEIEMSASIASTSSVAAPAPAPHLVCRLLDPTAVGLFGYAASSGLRLRVRVGPNGFARLKEAPL